MVRGESALLTELPITVILGNSVSDKRLLGNSALAFSLRLCLLVFRTIVFDPPHCTGLVVAKLLSPLKSTEVTL